MLIYGDIAGLDIKLSPGELARHEAGHTIAAAVLGWPIDWVGINEADGSGEVEPNTGPFFRLDEPFETRLGQPDGISRSRMAEMLEVDKAGSKVRC
jgi:hypothetical protein